MMDNAEQQQQLRQLAVAAKANPGQMMVGYDEGDREHLVAEALKHRREAERLDALAATSTALGGPDA